MSRQLKAAAPFGLVANVLARLKIAGTEETNEKGA